MIAIFAKHKLVVAALLLLGLANINRTLASDQKEAEHDQGIDLAIMRDAEEGDLSEYDWSSDDDNGNIAGELQAAHQITLHHSRCRLLFSCMLLTIVAVGTIIESTYLVYALVNPDVLLVCHSIVSFLSVVYGIICLKNPTNEQFIRLFVLGCASLVLGYFAKEKIFTTLYTIYSDVQKMECRYKN